MIDPNRMYHLALKESTNVAELGATPNRKELAVKYNSLVLFTSNALSAIWHGEVLLLTVQLNPPGIDVTGAN